MEADIFKIRIATGCPTAGGCILFTIPSGYTKYRISDVDTECAAEKIMFDVQGEIIDRRDTIQKNVWYDLPTGAVQITMMSVGVVESMDLR